jgi:hypothetical protein
MPDSKPPLSPREWPARPMESGKLHELEDKWFLAGYEGEPDAVPHDAAFMLAMG